MGNGQTNRRKSKASHGSLGSMVIDEDQKSNYSGSGGSRNSLTLNKLDFIQTQPMPGTNHSPVKRTSIDHIPNIDGPLQDSPTLAKNIAINFRPENGPGVLPLPTLLEAHEEHENEDPPEHTMVRRPTRSKYRPPGFDQQPVYDIEEKKEPIGEDHKQEEPQPQKIIPAKTDNPNNESSHPNLGGPIQNKPQEPALNHQQNPLNQQQNPLNPTNQHPIDQQQPQQVQSFPHAQQTQTHPGISTQPNQMQSKPQDPQQQWQPVHRNDPNQPHQQLSPQHTMSKVDPNISKNDPGLFGHGNSNLNPHPDPTTTSQGDLPQKHQNPDPNHHKEQPNNFPSQQRQDPQMIKQPEEHKSLSPMQNSHQMHPSQNDSHPFSNQPQNSQVHLPQKIDPNQQLTNSHSPTLNQNSTLPQNNKPVTPALNLSQQQPHQNSQPALQNQEQAISHSPESNLNSSIVQKQRPFPMTQSLDFKPPQNQNNHQGMSPQNQLPQNHSPEPHNLNNSQSNPQLNPIQNKPNQTPNMLPLSNSQPLHSETQHPQPNSQMNQSLNPKLLPNQETNQQNIPQQQQPEGGLQHPPNSNTGLPQNLKDPHSNEPKSQIHQPQGDASKLGPNVSHTNPDQTAGNTLPNTSQNEHPDPHKQEETPHPKEHSNMPSPSKVQQNNPNQEKTQGPNNQSHSQPPAIVEKQPSAQILKDPTDPHNFSANDSHSNKQPINSIPSESSQQNPQEKVNDPHFVTQPQKANPMLSPEKLPNNQTQLPVQNQTNPQHQQPQPASPQRQQLSNPDSRNFQPITPIKLDPKISGPDISKINTQPTVTDQTNQNTNNLQVKPNTQQSTLNSPTIGNILSSQHSPSTSDQTTKPTPTYVKPFPPSNPNKDFSGIKPRFQKPSTNLSTSSDHPKNMSLSIPDKSKEPNEIANHRLNLSQDVQDEDRGHSPRILPPNQKVVDYYAALPSTHRSNFSSNNEIEPPSHSIQGDTKFYNPRNFTPPKKQPQGLPALIIDAGDLAKARKPTFTNSPVEHPLLHKPQSRASSVGRRSSKSSTNNSSRPEIIILQNKPKQPFQTDPHHPHYINSHHHPLHQVIPHHYHHHQTNPHPQISESKNPELSPRFHRQIYPEDTIAGIFQHAPYDSQELLSTHTGSVWISSPKSANKFTASKFPIKLEPEYYNTLARGEYNRQGEIPYKHPEQQKVGRSGNFPAEEARGRHIMPPSHPHPNTVNDSYSDKVRTGISSDRVQPINSSIRQKDDCLDDRDYSIQGTSAKRTKVDVSFDENSPYNEFSGRFDSQNDKVNIESYNPWRRQFDSTTLPAINSKHNYVTHVPQIFKRIDHYNPLIKAETPNQNSRPNSLASNVSQLLQPEVINRTKFPKIEPGDYILKAETNLPNDKSPRHPTHFEFTSCINVLTTDNTLENLKSGHSLEFILNKANIPNDRAKAKVIKKMFELNLERGSHLRQPLHVKELVDQFLTTAKTSLKEPFTYLEDLANEGNTPKPEFHDLLELNVEFFHFMGFYQQHEKVLNYYDRWWNFPRDDEYIASLKDRTVSDGASLRRQINELIWRRKDIQEKESESSQPWNYTRVWGGREVRALETSQRYLKHLFTEAIRKKNRGMA